MGLCAQVLAGDHRRGVPMSAPPRRSWRLVVGRDLACAPLAPRPRAVGLVGLARRTRSRPSVAPVPLAPLGVFLNKASSSCDAPWRSRPARRPPGQQAAASSAPSPRPPAVGPRPTGRGRTHGGRRDCAPARAPAPDGAHARRRARRNAHPVAYAPRPPGGRAGGRHARDTHAPCAHGRARPSAAGGPSAVAAAAPPRGPLTPPAPRRGAPWP